MGFDIKPIKGSRRDHFNLVTINDETGIMTAAVWCKDHVPTKSTVHRMHRIVDDSGLNALQLYVRNFKQADLTLTGTVRKATLINLSANVTARSASLSSNRRALSNTNGPLNSIRNCSTHNKAEDFTMANSDTPRKICVTCHIDVSPKWWLYQGDPFIPTNSQPLTNSIEICNEVFQKSKSDPVTQLRSSYTSDKETHVALAAAALDQNSPMVQKCQLAPLLPIEYQCHQCHWKKIKMRKFLTPSTNSIDSVQSPFTSPLVTAQNSRVESELLQALRQSHQWSVLPPVHIQNGVINELQTCNWLHRSPVAPNSSTINLINGNCPPLPDAGDPQTPQVSQSHVRQQPSLSLQQNIQADLKNGFPSQGSTSSKKVCGPNKSYISYLSSRPPPSPQHLINGGPPPHASESLFSQSNRSAHQQCHSLSFNESSPLLCFDKPPSRSHEKISGQKNDDPSNDGRINGGASASPSLRNLLH